MQEAFKVLARAIQDAQRRLNSETIPAKAATIRHAIKELEEAQEALKYMNNNRTELVRLWLKVEEGSRTHVPVHSSSNRGPRRSQGNRRKP